jgi:phosphoribosylaminoimidazolecarboxamide formyltransferase/IMP cyclohydrolase
MAHAQPHMLTIAGMASNRGRNLRNIADRRPGGADLAVVVTDDSEAPVLEAAADRGIDTAVVERSAGMDRRDHERQVLEALEGYDPDVVLLDGYMRILSETFLDGVPLTLNVHPSLLPAFPGMDAHEQVLEAGVAITGCTVHVVNDAVEPDGSVDEDAVDSGPIVTQEAVPVYADDDPQSLKQRVLYKAEFKAYPRAVRWLTEDRLTVEGDDVTVDGDTDGQFPERRLAAEDRWRDLRYGENPHQDAALYADPTTEEASVVHADQLNPGAKALSYNNYNDADAALDLIKEFEEPAAAVIKHTNPAGCAVADSVAAAYDRALATDAKSAFGGIVALNRRCTAAAAEQIVDSYKEAVVAPGYTADALDVLRESDDLRVLDVGPEGAETLGERTETLTEKPLVGGRLVQERDLQAPTADDLDVVTERSPTEAELETMLFAWRTLKHVKSNGIVFATGRETVGIGMGQVSRVDAVTLAAMKAEKDAEGKSADGSVMASDAFFPFRDGIDEAAEAGVAAVIQPGGSVNDDEVIAAADEHDMAMAFTGSRCFRHD